MTTPGQGWFDQHASPFERDRRHHAYDGDGDGMVHAVRLDHGKVGCRNRWFEARPTRTLRVVSPWQGRPNQFTCNVLFPQDGREEPRSPGPIEYDLRTADLVACSAGPRHFCNTPGFAPRDDCRAEDDGHLVTPVWNPLDQGCERWGARA